MATRNLTDEFAQLRAELHASRDPSEPRSRGGSQHKGLLDDGGSANPLSAARGAGPAVANMLPPAWVDAVESVERDFANIDAQLAALKGLHRARLMVSFGSDEAAQDADIERAGKAITGHFRKAESTLKHIQAETSGAGRVSQAEAKLRGNVVRTLAGRLQDKSVLFRRAQKDFLVRRSDQKSSTSGGALAGAEQGDGGGFDFLGIGGSGEEKGSRGAALVDVGLDLGMEQGMTLAQLAAVDDVEVQVAKRDHEINAIVESIEELSQIFKELAVLVIDQGTVLDRIDYNMEQVVDKVEDGVVQLIKAEEYQKSARPRWCIAFLLFFISVLMALLVLKHRPKDKGKNADDDGGSAADDGSSTGGVIRMLRGNAASGSEILRPY